MGLSAFDLLPKTGGLSLTKDSSPLGSDGGGPYEETIFRRPDHREFEGAGGGFPVSEIIRRHGIAEQTFSRWKSKCGGMEVSEAKRLKEL